MRAIWLAGLLIVNIAVGAIATQASDNSAIPRPSRDAWLVKSAADLGNVEPPPESEGELGDLKALVNKRSAAGLSMEFTDQAAYDTYNDHPIHVAFVRDRWKTEVSDFMEIDYVKI
jgi:hypothetical protein